MSWTFLLTTTILLLQMGWVECSGRGQIQFLRYTDTKDMDSSSSTSDFYFSPIDIKDEDDTILHRIVKTQQSFWNMQDFNLSQVSQLANPITIEFPTNKNVYVNISVWDFDGPTANSDNDFVRSMTNMAVPFSGKQAGEDWTEVEYSKTDGDGQASLILKYKITECDKGFSGAGCNSCAEGWTGESCSECAEGWTGDSCSECAERWTGDSCSECAKGWTGDSCSECAEGWTGESCTECAEGWTGDSCSECAEGWTGESCSECAENYYPAGECTNFCEPETNRYTCTSEGNKECLENLHGENCSHFCEESDNYVCNQDGSKACKQDYYPEGECTVFCTETSSFTCSEEGLKVCAERRKGHDCEICDSHYFGENCSTFCKANEKYICSEIGEKKCVDDNADPDSDCLKNNNIMIIGIVAGIVILAFLVGSVILVCVKRGRRRNLENGEVNTNVTLTTIKSNNKVPPTGDPEDSDGIYSDLGGSADGEIPSGTSVEEKNVYIDADEDSRLEDWSKFMGKPAKTNQQGNSRN